jgi:3-hydroxymyristoyl/3-hydroxydecanoyl-(acyl carrier protein) dehydratase
VSATAPPETFASELLVDPGHPSLPGHFPGRPVVPGVVLLDAVVDALERRLGTDVRVCGLPQVKFLQPLLPGEPARIELALDAARARFRILRGDTLVASGELEVAP